MGPVLVLPHFLTDIVREKWITSYLKNRRTQIKRELPITASQIFLCNAGDAKRLDILKRSIPSIKKQEEKPQGVVVEGESPTPFVTYDQGLFFRGFHNHRGTIRRKKMSVSPRYRLMSVFAKCRQIHL